MPYLSGDLKHASSDQQWKRRQASNKAEKRRPLAGTSVCATECAKACACQASRIDMMLSLHALKCFPTIDRRAGGAAGSCVVLGQKVPSTLTGPGSAPRSLSERASGPVGQAEVAVASKWQPAVASTHCRKSTAGIRLCTAQQISQPSSHTALR